MNTINWNVALIDGSFSLNQPPKGLALIPPHCQGKLRALGYTVLTSLKWPGIWGIDYLCNRT